MDLRTAERFAHSHMCPDCGHTGALVPVWAGTGYGVRCGRCRRADQENFPRIKSLTRQWRENPDSVPIPMANRFADKYRGQIEAETEGLPEDMAAAIRRKYLGAPIKK